MQALIVNADDYAHDAGVDDAILTLIDAGRVTATSAMSLSPRWPQAARALHGRPVDVGLHFDLSSPFAASHEPALACPGAGGLLARGLLRRLPATELQRAAHAQLQRFEDAFGAPPRFIDGHQHVHQLPVVRQVLLDTLAQRYGPRATAIGVRICTAQRWRGIKALIIQATGAQALQGLAAGRGHPVNSDFAGVYNFAETADLPALWLRWLTGLQGSSPMVMCHVATPDGAVTQPDPIRAARVREFAWLGSAGWLELCQAHGLRPMTWSSSMGLS